MSQIKQLQPKEGVTIATVLLPEGAKGAHTYLVGQNKFLIYFLPCGEKLAFWKQEQVKLPEVNWQLLGIATEIPEEVWQGIMPKSERHPDLNKWGDFKAESDRYAYLLDTATESAMSFLEANEVYSVNPYGGIWPRSLDSPPCSLAIQDHMRKLFLTAESNTGTWVVFKTQD